MKKALTDLDLMRCNFPCAGHKINSYTVDFLKKFNIIRYTNCKGRNIINIKRFNKDDELRTIEIAEAEARKYEEVNLLKDKLNSLIAKCKSLVSLFRHSEGNYLFEGYYLDIVKVIIVASEY
ncbi:uncharacterized protein LOC136087208 [Hydra vulgaris]|uniref:Uncharacterized protein LOC136087208 n=1 Tax=Hydra vulgaris TaxID=6087 RepID=A0ABM4CV12_HYDVU